MNEPKSAGSEKEALEQFEARQREELEAFKKQQQEAFEAFARKEQEELEEFEHRQHSFKIKIDRTEYVVHKELMTGLELRQLVNPPIPPDRDLFEVVMGGSDRKIGDTEEVKIRDGLRFFTAPAQINPGCT